MINVSLFILCSNIMEITNYQCTDGIDRKSTIHQTLLPMYFSQTLCHPRAFKQPVHICRNVSFVVNLHKLNDPVDVTADENGVWVQKGSPVAYVSMHAH